MRSHVIGLFISIFIIYYAFTNTGNDSLAYFDKMSILIVVGGSLSVAIITNGFLNTLKIFSLFFKIFSTSKYDNLKITKELVDLSVQHHFGHLSITPESDKIHHPFIQEGLRLINNKFDYIKLRHIMSNMMIQRLEHDERLIEKIEVLAKYPPAFGMMGTIIGLVAVLKEINSPENMSAIGPSMAVALLTTLYGILISNYILQPIADNLHARNQNEIQIHQLIAEGIILMAEDHDPVYIREALLSFLTPQERIKFLQMQSEDVLLKEVAA